MFFLQMLRCSYYTNNLTMIYNNSIPFYFQRAISKEQNKETFLNKLHAHIEAKKLTDKISTFNQAGFDYKKTLEKLQSDSKPVHASSKLVSNLQEVCTSFYEMEVLVSTQELSTANQRSLLRYSERMPSFRQWDRDAVCLAIVINKLFLHITKSTKMTSQVIELSKCKITRQELLNIELIKGIKIRDLKASGTILDKLDKYYEDEDLIYEFDLNLCSNDEKRRFNGFQKHKRIIRKIRVRENELIQLSEKAIGSHNSYCSRIALDYRNYVDECQKDYLLNSYIQYGDDVSTQKPLNDVAMTPERRVAELYSCVKNMELVAEQRKYVCLFLTATCPASFHANPKFGKNTWDGSTPRQASDYLSKKIDQLSKARNRYELNDFGLWTKELHKDQCPHLHALLFVCPTKVDDLILHINRIFKHSEKSTTIEIISAEQAQKHGKKRASASTYVMKYLIKAIQNPDSESLKVKAGCMVWGIRRYGFFGVERAISVWRKFNRFVKMEEWQIKLELKHPVFRKLASLRKDLKFLDFCKVAKERLEWITELKIVERLYNLKKWLFLMLG
ncbi:replication endonuclease [Pseudomonas fluorescens]|nr:replication endonuclease [Pseudomonas fluorescens]